MRNNFTCLLYQKIPFILRGLFMTEKIIILWAGPIPLLARGGTILPLTNFRVLRDPSTVLVSLASEGQAERFITKT